MSPRILYLVIPTTGTSYPEDECIYFDFYSKIEVKNYIFLARNIAFFSNCRSTYSIIYFSSFEGFLFNFNFRC